jgi:DNA helicase-2/ATP-dependent DNA helicase PcrA
MESGSAILEGLNRQQRYAAEYSLDHGNIMLLAGAGTGKTRTIIARAAFLLKNDVNPSRILLLTFTRRAAEEIKDRLSSEFGAVALDIFAGTFHRFCLDTMRTVPEVFGIKGRSLIDRDDQVGIMRKARAVVVKRDKNKFPRAAKLADYYSYARNTGDSPENYLGRFTSMEQEETEAVLKIFSMYEENKTLRGYMDFDDILVKFSDTLKENPDFGGKFKSLFDFILVDEMQDTNPLQWDIIQGIYDPGRLFCVGDDAQSIYAFRGADFKNVHSFSERVKDPVILKLEENYRSTQEILDVSNWLLEQSPNRYGKKLSAARGQGVRPRLLDFQDKYDEASWITGDIYRRVSGGVPWSEHMVLARSAYSARQLETAFIEKDIPYRFIGGTTLLQASHVKDVLAMARVAGDRSDEISWVRFLKLWPRIGDATAFKIFDMVNSAPDYAVSLEMLRKRFSSCPELPEGLKNIRENRLAPAQALESAATALEKVLSVRYDNWPQRKKDINLLIEIADNFSSIEDFIETYTLDPLFNSEARGSSADDVVTLITVHSAKGTECKVCYVLRVQPGVFPHSRSLSNEAQLEEERRVLYVAFTRARDELIITRNSMRNFYAFDDADEKPCFIDGIPPELLDQSFCGGDSGSSFLDDLKKFYY